LESGFLRPILKKSYPHFKVFFHILNFFLKNLIYNIASIAKASKLKAKAISKKLKAKA
jgi:hypothetical protein